MTHACIQVQHHAMKADMERQMLRIAHGLDQERALISYFKSAAINSALAGRKDHLLPLFGDRLEMMRAMRHEVR